MLEIELAECSYCDGWTLNPISELCGICGNNFNPVRRTVPPGTWIGWSLKRPPVICIREPIERKTG